MITEIKNSFHHNRGYWFMMVASSIILLVYFRQNLETLVSISLTWSFAVSWHKIFIDDFAIPKLKTKEAEK